MGCPHSSGSPGRDREGVDRRQFLLSAVAIGGTSALAACMSREETQPSRGATNQSVQNGAAQQNTTETGSPPTDETEPLEEEPSEQEPSEEPDPPEEPPVYRNLDRTDAQHAWNSYSTTNEHGVPHPPRHHILVLADYTGTGVPTEGERTTMERTLQQLETAYEWSNDGLMFTVGYSPAYFDRFDTDLPPEVDLPEPSTISVFDDPVMESYDVSIHLASDHAQAVLGAEEALFGAVDEIQGVTVEDDLQGVLEKRDRRTGFIGEGLPAQNQDVEGIPDSEPVPEDSPLYMGFQTNHGTKDGHPFHGETDATFVHNQNSEYGVMIKKGRFKYGTTQHVSRLRLELDEWYENHSLEERVDKMFGGQFSAEIVGETGEGAREARVFTEQRDLDTSGGLVGHAEKMALAREQGVPQLLRRDFDTIDNDHAGVHFVALQEKIADFVKTRSIMNGARFQSVEGVDGQQNNGILEFVTAESRANFLVPPRELRSLPTPQ